MKVPFIDLGRVHRPLEAAVFRAVRGAFRRNAFVLGEEVRRLEEGLARLSGARYGVGVSSGTAALTLTLRALGVKAGDEVVTSPFTFFATAAAVAYLGARPRFADVEPGTLNLDPEKLAGAVNRRTRAVIPVHIFGNPARMDLVNAAARGRRLAVIEDACQAHGAVYKGTPVGGWGTAGCFSFYPTKNLGGLGDGGLVTTSDGGLAETLRALRNCGRREGPYDHELLGYVDRLDNLQAAALLVKLEKLSAWNRERRRLAAIYREELADGPAVPLAVAPGAEPVYHLFTVRAPRRDELLKRLASKGIGAGVFYGTPLHLQKAFREFGGRPGDFPVAERAAREVLSLPLYPGLPPSAVRYVAGEVRRFYR